MNMETGGMNLLKRRRLDTIGDTMHDPFFDNYQEEGLVLCDIIKMLNECKEDLITLTFGKVFLKKLVRSHILFIKEIEKAL